MYAQPGQALAVYVVAGRLTVENAGLATELR
jgi:hypothetical protein